MSQQTQLVIFFRCQHEETATVNVDRSSQQNRNFWSRVKKWSSTTLAETKYQQSSSLCQRCLETERIQITVAAELRHQMATNAAQERRLAAPPAQGVSATIAALALPGDETAIQTLRRAQSLTHHQEELEVVDHADWQSQGALAAQRDLHRIVTFWEKQHSEHAGHASDASSGGPKSCVECKKIEISLADPVFRRQAGLSDVKLRTGVWYGTDGMEDPWSSIISFGPVRELVSKAPKIDSDEAGSSKPVKSPIANSSKATVPEKTLQPEIAGHKLKSEDITTAKIEEPPLSIPETVTVRKTDEEIFFPSNQRGTYDPKAQQPEPPSEEWLREHRRMMIDIRIENFRLIQNARERRAWRELHPVADTGVKAVPLPEIILAPEAQNSGPVNPNSKHRPLLPPWVDFNKTRTVSLFPSASNRESRERVRRDENMAQGSTSNAIPHTKWIGQPLELILPDGNKFMSDILPAPGTFVALPPQEEAEIEVLEWYDRYHELLPHLPTLPPQDQEELEALFEQDSGRVYDSVLVLLPLPPRDEVEVEALSGHGSPQEEVLIPGLPSLPPQTEQELEVLEWYDRHQEYISNFPALPAQNMAELDALYQQYAWQQQDSPQVLSPTPTQEEPESVPDNKTQLLEILSPVLPALSPQDESELQALEEDIPSERQWNPDELPHRAPADIDPSSPLGVQAIQRIRDYFHIPMSISPSGFQEFWWARPKLRRGMTEDRTLASRASTHRKSTSGAQNAAPSDLLDEIPDLYFGENVFLMQSSDQDIATRIEISDLCDRIMWHKHSDAPEKAVSEWEQSDDENDETDEELERKRQAAVDTISQDIPNSQLDSPLEVSLDTIPETTPRPKTPTMRIRESIEGLQGTFQPIDPSYSDSDSDSDSSSDLSSSPDEEESETGTRITTISAPILEVPSSQHNVTIRSLLREELVFVEWDESERVRKWF